MSHRDRHPLAGAPRRDDGRARLQPRCAALRPSAAADTGAHIDYVEGTVADAVELPGAGRFDLVYTGVGALNWLPDIVGWARVVAALLRPGGRLHLREGHPVLWALDEPRSDGLLALEYPCWRTASTA